MFFAIAAEGMVILAGALYDREQAGVMAAEQEIWFQKEIAEFAARDRKAPPSPGGVLFTGSSIFRFWVYLDKDMSPLPVLNRAFGGARTWEVLHYMDSIVLPYRPRIIVYYCGSNDIHFGARPEDIQKRFAQFARRVRSALPETRIFFVSIIKAPQKMDAWERIGTANALIQQYCSSEARLGYIDVNPAFFTAQGAARRELYIDDGLHVKPEAYREMTKLIKPVLVQAMRNE